jgi:hypothetical protein
MALALTAGVLEGAIVGGLLGLVLTSCRPELRLRAWVMATIAGAVVGWGLGSLASLFMSAGSNQAEPPLGVTIAAAAALGLAAGPILGAFQARALRVVGLRPSRWIVANALGWAMGMPLVFLAADSAWTSATAIARGAALLGLAGAAVGLATATALVRSPTPARPSQDAGRAMPIGRQAAAARLT